MSKMFGTLSKSNGAVDITYDPFSSVIDSPSPSLNWLFGHAHGLPFGYSVVFHGLPRCGKSVIANSMIARLHEVDPDALAIKYDSEMRTSLQSQNNLMNIDPDRLLTIETTRPSEIFDHIEKDVVAAIQEGKKIRMIVIDSLNGISGRREMDAKSVEDVQIGDMAVTLGAGLKRILPIIRRHKIALICTAQARAEMNPIEKMRGNDYKIALAAQALHILEWQILITQNKNKDSKILDTENTDFMNKGLLKGHKIRAVVTASSASPVGRTAEFTLDYTKGIINIGEEVAKLSTDVKKIVKVEGRSYIYEDKKYNGWDAFVNACEKDLQFREQLIEEVKKADRLIKL